MFRQIMNEYFYSNMSNFHPLEVVDRGSDAQFQVGEHLNKITGKGLNKWIAAN